LNHSDVALSDGDISINSAARMTAPATIPARTAINSL
jgi:hypothetical protein